MAGIKHPFQSGVGDGGDASKLRPSNWNADHVVDGAILVDEVASPSTPASGKSLIYPKSDGRWYSKGDDGIEHGPFDAGGSGYVATISAEANLVQYWPLNEAHGATSFADTEGGTALTPQGANNPGAGGPPMNSDPDGGSVSIQDNTQRIGRTAITWPGSAFTLEAWVFLPVTPGTGGVGLFGQWNGVGSMVYIDTVTTTRVYSGANFEVWSSTAAELRGWHHALIGHDGTNIKLFWDGVEEATGAQTKPSSTDGGPLQIGGYNSGTGAGCNGAYSDLALYSDYDSGRAAAHYALGHP